MVNQHKEASENNVENNGSSVFTLTPPRAGKYKVATTTPKMSILFKQSTDIKFDYFGNFGFLYSQMAHRDSFGDDPMIFSTNPTNQNKNMSEKEIYAFSELCMFDIFINIIGILKLVQIILMIQGSHRRCSN